MLLGGNKVLEVIMTMYCLFWGKSLLKHKKSPRVLQWMGKFLQLRLQEDLNTHHLLLVTVTSFDGATAYNCDKLLKVKKWFI